MTTIAIYSGGPNLEKTMQFGFPLAIAVNRALPVTTLAGHAPDWYCAGDLNGYADDFAQHRRPLTGWSTMDAVTQHRVQTLCHGWSHLAHRHWGELPLYPKLSPNYSITGAYLLAHALGATRIVTFGVDRLVNGALEPARNNPKRLVERYPDIRSRVEADEQRRFQEACGIPIEHVRLA